jgi:hypothetical protein
MLSAHVVSNYAVFGAVAQMRYTEAVATMDAEVLVALPHREGLDVLGPIYRFCADRGYEVEGEAIRVGDWPVKFIPTFNALTEEALMQAQTGDIDGLPLRVVGADYLATIALSTGRPKDFARILSLLEAGVVSESEIEKLAQRHGFSARWRSFRRRFLA